jgi:hypothetical protein
MYGNDNRAGTRTETVRGTRPENGPETVTESAQVGP